MAMLTQYNMQFYYVITEWGNWGRGMSLVDAMKAAKANSKTRLSVSIGVCKWTATYAQVENIMNCFSVNDFGGLSKCIGLSKEDEEMVEKYFVTWANLDVAVSINLPKKMKR